MDLGSKLKCIHLDTRWKWSLLHPAGTVMYLSGLGVRIMEGDGKLDKNCEVVYYLLRLFSIEQNGVKLTIIIKHKDNQRCQNRGSSELGISAWVNPRVCDEMGNVKKQV